MVTAFRKGDVVTGYAVIDHNKVYCASATLTVFEDIDDFIALEDIEIARQIKFQRRNGSLKHNIVNQ